MSCTLAAIATCFHLSGFYVDAQYAAADAGLERYTVERDSTVVIHGSVRETWLTDTARYTQTPYRQNVRIALGYLIDITPRCFVYAEAWHYSSPETGRDRGINAAALGSRCRLFKSASR